MLLIGYKFSTDLWLKRPNLLGHLRSDKSSNVFVWSSAAAGKPFPSKYRRADPKF